MFDHRPPASYGSIYTADLERVLSSTSVVFYLARYRDDSKDTWLHLNPCVAMHKRSVDQFIPAINWNVSVLLGSAFRCGWSVQGPPTSVQSISRYLGKMPAHPLNVLFLWGCPRAVGPDGLSALRAQASVSRISLGCERDLYWACEIG